jgi:hypothetical protein
MSQSAQKNQGEERRRSKRRPVIDTFSLFCVVPKKGVHRLKIHDVSDQGIGFDLDIDGEDIAEFPLKTKENLEVHLYLNQSLYLSLPVSVARLEDGGGIRRVGAEFTDRSGASYKAYAAFLQMLDLLGEAAQITQG